jgi:hypothetical protein
MGISNKVIGVLGTAKNTGKTTTTSFLLKWANLENTRVGLTSIGYDGEDIDNVTGLPKPRIFINAGGIIATAEKCLSQCEAEIEVIEKTTIMTSLGRVVIGRVFKEGLVVLAGPNKGKDLQHIVQILKQQNTKMILVDGALNRMIPLIYCDALILATGASRHTDIDLLVNETESITKVYSLPVWEKEKVSNKSIKMPQNNIVIFQKNGSKINLNDYSLISQKTLNNIINNIDKKETEVIYIPGIIQDEILKEIFEKYSKLFKEKTILISNPAFLLVGSRDIRNLKELINNLLIREINLNTIHNLPILAITINPFYPKYNRFGKESYEASWIDRFELYREMEERIPFPVINIMEKEKENLIKVVSKFLNTI